MSVKKKIRSLFQVDYNKSAKSCNPCMDVCKKINKKINGKKLSNVSNKKVKVLPDGNAHFTRSMGMFIQKNHVGFGMRSWKYCAIINDGVIEKWWQEEGMNNDGSDPDPYIETTPENCMEYLSNNK